ncbi:MAG: hypothetical protein WCT40_03275 [Candidatus Magasanikbacteria bacterium]|jgi:hypothetical protein
MNKLILSSIALATLFITGCSSNDTVRFFGKNNTPATLSLTGVPTLSADHETIVANGKILLSIDNDAIFDFFKTKSQLCDASNTTNDPDRKLFCENKSTFKSHARFTSIVVSPDKAEIGFTVETDVVTPDKVVGIFYPTRPTNAVNFLTSYYLGSEFISFSPSGKNFVYQGFCWEAMCGLFIKNSNSLATITEINNPEYADLRTQKVEFVRWISDDEIEYKLGTELKQASFCTAVCSKNLCVKSDPAVVSITYLISTEDKLKFCNGADMDSDGYRKTITQEITTTTIACDSLAKTAQNIAVIATDGQCQTALKQLDFSINDGTLSIPPLDGWAGVSIAMCSCKPQVEINLLRLPGIKQIVWQ